MNQYKVSFLKEGCFFINAESFHLLEETIIFYRDNGEEIKEVFVPSKDVKIEPIDPKDQIEHRIQKDCD